LFVRPRAEGFPAYIATHFEEQARCLEQWFDVTVVPPEGDYAALCETHRPDAAVFESGVYMRSARNITNTDACPQIPKLGFLNSDAYCPTRRAFLSDMEHWGIETFFTHSVSMAEHTPEIANRLFVWPNSIDPQIYRDHGATKIIPLLLTGSRDLHYPWRNQIMDLVSQRYPTLRTPHFGWMDRSKTSGMVQGLEYAKLINASLLAPTCGTIANEVVRKHFEIPGCRTCLLTEATPGLSAAGFVDMENCVFVDAGDVLEKLDYLFANEDVLRAITDRGYAMVHERHTWANRDQILQWLSLNRSLRPGQRIAQLGPFDRLVAVDDQTGFVNGHVHSRGPYRSLLEEARERSQAGEHARAETLYLRCMNYHAFAPEPHLGIAICALNRGDAPGALQWMRRLLYELDDCKVADPDPVEWAYFIIALLCLGKLNEATQSARQYPELRHPELARTRMALAAITGAGAAWPDLLNGVSRAPRPTVHRLPVRDDSEWFANLAAILSVCGQKALAARLRRSAPHAAVATPIAVRASAPPVRGDRARPREKLTRRLRRHALRTLADPIYPTRFLAAHGKPDLFAELVANEARDNQLSSILLVASRHWSTSSHALLNGIRHNPALPVFLRVGSAGSLDIDRPVSPALALPPPTGADALRSEMMTRGVGHFDLVLIDGVAPRDFDDLDVLADAGIVVIDRLDSERNHLIARRLIQPGSGYRLTACNPVRNGGYAAFRRQDPCSQSRADDIAYPARPWPALA
jgi:hypothetical protein